MNNQRDWVDALDVYSQYFNAHCVSDGSERKAAIVKLTLMKDIEGIQEYQISASFFPFRDPEDFLVANDVLVSKTVLAGIKRRNRKKEAEIMKSFRDEIDAILPELKADAVIYWDRPLLDARWG